jgi:putative endonuclease
LAWTVYVLRSATHPATYVGIALDVERRLRQHNGELPGGARFTRGGRPWSLAARYGPYESRGEAQRAEHRLRSLRGLERLEWTGLPDGEGDASAAGG